MAEEEEAMDVDSESDSIDDDDVEDDDDTSSGIIHVMSGSDFPSGSELSWLSDESDPDWSSNEESEQENSSGMDQPDGTEDEEREVNVLDVESVESESRDGESDAVETAANSRTESLSSSNSNPASEVSRYGTAEAIPQNERQLEIVIPVVLENTEADVEKDSKKLSPVRTEVKAEFSQTSPNDKSEDEGQSCPICFETWTSSGTHRLVSLRCGHLFGLSCIERWIKGSKAKCPQCNAPARKNDIRHLYTRNLKALDTTERDQALKDLDREKELRRHAELEAANVRMKYQMSIQECEKLKKELIDNQAILQRLRSSRKRDSSTLDDKASDGSRSIVFTSVKTLELSKEGGCRVMGHSAFLPMLVVTQESCNKLFPGFGIKKVSTVDMKPAEFFVIHQKTIRDLAFHYYDSLILTTSLDKTVKITNVLSNSVVQTYPLDTEAWSCCWSKDDSCCFYTGLRNGGVLQFDMRMTAGPVDRLPPTGHVSPVVALQYIPKRFRPALNVSGPVVLQLSSSCFFEKSGDAHQLHPLPIEGNFTSLCLEPTGGQFLVSCRPSVKHPKVTHMLCEMEFEKSAADIECAFKVVKSVYGGSTQVKLCKSRAFPNPANECSTLVCAGDDNAQAALVWDVNTGKCLQQLKVDSSALDICNFQVQQNHFLSTLTEHTLRVYRWTRD